MNDKTVVVVGNGESRTSVDLAALSKKYTLIGCNGIHRDITVPHLVCCDRRMVSEAVSNPNNKNSTIYTRKDWFAEFPGTISLPQLPYSGTRRADNQWHWGSGPSAILVACNLEPATIKLIGFDLYSFNGSVNNIYKGSPNYAGKLSQPVDYSYWEYQISKLFECYSTINFEIYNTSTWQLPLKWNLPNVTVFDIEKF